VNASHAATVDEFLADLGEAVAGVTSNQRRGGAGAYGTVD